MRLMFAASPRRQKWSLPPSAPQRYRRMLQQARVLDWHDCPKQGCWNTSKAARLKLCGMRRGVLWESRGVWHTGARRRMGDVHHWLLLQCDGLPSARLCSRAGGHDRVGGAALVAVTRLVSGMRESRVCLVV